MIILKLWGAGRKSPALIIALQLPSYEILFIFQEQFKTI